MLERELYGGGKMMSLMGHLAELRTRIVYSVLTLLAFFGISVFFAKEIILYLEQPLRAALPASVHVLHFTGPLDVFMASLKVGVVSGVILSSPVWIYQFWRFIEPALYVDERKYVLPFVLASVLLFIFGILFSYFITLPLGLEFLIGMGQEVGTPIITITDYLSLVTVMVFGFGFVFEVPLVLVLLGLLGVVTPTELRKARRYVIILILFVAALLTPPDPLSQIGMAIPLYIMYEIAIVVIAYLTRKRSTKLVPKS